MPTYQTLQEVTDGLRRCVGYGASKERLGVNRRAFQSLPGLPSLDGLHAAAAGALIRGHLIKAGIGRLAGTYQLFDRAYPAETVASALRLELAFTHWDWTARRRRLEVITLLGTNHSPGYWAREDGPEWDLLYLFAEHLCGQEQGSANPIEGTG